MIGVNIIIPSVYNIGKEVAREQLPMKKIVLLIYTQTIKMSWEYILIKVNILLLNLEFVFLYVLKYIGGIMD